MAVHPVEGGSPVTTAALPLPRRVARLAGRREQPHVRAVLAASMINISVGVVYTWSVFLDPLKDEFSVRATTLTAGFSGMLVAFTLGVLMGGRTVQRAPGRATRISAGGSLVALLVAAAAPSAATVVGAVVVMGAAGGLAYAMATGVAAVALPRHRGLSVAFVMTGAAAGPLLLAPAASGLVALFGWRTAFAVLGIASAAAILAAGRRIEPDVAGGTANGDVAAPQDSPDRRITLILLWLIFFLASVPCLMGFGHAAAVASERGVPVAFGGFAVAAMSVGDIGGRVLSSGSTTQRRTIALSAAVATIVAGAALLATTDDATVALVGFAVLGVGYGGHISLVAATTSDHVRRDGYSKAFGRVYTAWGIAAVGGPFTAAALHDATGSYRGAFAIGSVASAAALCLAVSLHVILHRRGRRRGR